LLYQGLPSLLHLLFLLLVQKARVRKRPVYRRGGEG